MARYSLKDLQSPSSEESVISKPKNRYKLEDLKPIEPVEDDTPSRVLAVPRALGQAILPIGDEIVGGYQTAVDAVHELGQGNVPSIKELLDKYTKHRDVERGKVKKSYEMYPGESYGTEVGSLAIPAGPLGKLAGSAMGSLQGYLASESEDPIQQVKDTVTGGTVGKALDLGGKAVSGIANKVPELLSPLLGVSPKATRTYIEKGSDYLDNVPDIEVQESDFTNRIAPQAIRMLKEGTPDTQKFFREAPLQDKGEIADIIKNKIANLEESSGMIRADNPVLNKDLNTLQNLAPELESKAHLQNAASFPQIAASIESGILPTLRGDIRSGSAASRRAAESYGELPQQPIRDILAKHQRELEGRLGGKSADRPDLKSTSNYLNQVAKEWSPKISQSTDGVTSTIAKDTVSGERLKDLIQGLQSNVEYVDKKTGQIMRPDSAIRGRVAADINKYAKDTIPEFEPIMADVANAKGIEQELLTILGKDTPQIERSIRKVGQGADETGEISGTIKKIEERTGHKDILDRIKLAAEKEGFEKKYGKKLADIKDIDKMSVSRLVDMIHNLEKTSPQLSDLTAQLREYGAKKHKGFDKAIEDLDLGKEVIKDVERITKSSGTFRNVMRSVGSKSEGFVRPSELLERIGALTGDTKLVENAERWMLKKHFSRDITAGSKGVRLTENLLSGLPIGDALKGFFGAMRDVYGTAAAKSVIKKVADINEGMKKGDKIAYKLLDEVRNSASQGNTQAIITSEILRSMMQQPTEGK